MRTQFLSGDITIVKKYETRTKKGTLAVGFVEYDGELFVYREVDFNDKDHSAAAKAANKGGGNWDYAILKDNLIDLDDGAFDMELTGFDAIELEDILGGDALPTPEEEKEEETSIQSGEICSACGSTIKST